MFNMIEGVYLGSCTYYNIERAGYTKEEIYEVPFHEFIATLKLKWLTKYGGSVWVYQDCPLKLEVTYDIAPRHTIELINNSTIIKGCVTAKWVAYKGNNRGVRYVHSI